MATYNGELYIRDQINSILTQIGSNDEVIIVDDCSVDKTFNILQDYVSKDARIKIFRNEKNIGHVINFERALSISCGDLVILSDQDDIWAENKYQKIIEIFNTNDSVGMIYHSFQKINSDGFSIEKNPLYSNRVLKINRPLFLLCQFFSFAVFGCTMAMRRKIVSIALPFPQYATYAHDHWLTVLSSFISEVVFLDMPLVLYRQHGRNVTPKFGLNIFDKINVRFKLLVLLMFAAIRAKH